MSQQQPPYIGSKISLVSKLDIRYEGILYSVDAVEATIALAKVHSFGTEDRRTPVFVPPREEMYQFIVFKANDIKDLLVCETAKSANSVSHELPYDPAIVSISKNPPPEPKLPTKLNLNGPAHIRGAQHQLTQPFMGASDVTHHQQFTYRNNNNNGGNRPLRELRSNRPSLREDHNQAFFFQPPHQQQPHNIHQRMPPARIESVPLPFGDNRSPKPRIKFDSDYDFEEANKKFLEQIILDLGEKTEKVKISPEKAVEAEQESAAEKENGKTIDTTSEGEEKLAPKGVTADENVTAIAADEQPNDGIEKGGSKDENTADAKGTQEGEESEQLFYDKSASFFDNISCDASERESGYNMRPDWKHMRQTNTETFGQAAVRSLLHQYQQQRRGAMAMFGGGGPYMMGAAGPARSGGGGGRPKAGGYQRTQHQQVVGYRHQN